MAGPPSLIPIHLPPVEVLVLSAGRSTRFVAGNKHLALLRGEPLLVASIRCFRADQGIRRVNVAIPRGAEALAAVANSTGARSILVGTGGLGDTIRQASAHISRDAALLLALGDQPEVPRDLITEILAAREADDRRWIQPVLRDAPSSVGHPVLVGRGVRHLLTRLHGDRGLSCLAEARPFRREVSVAQLPRDVDTVSDLKSFER